MDNNVKKLRIAAGLEPRELARLSDSALNTIYRIERGEGAEVDTMRRIGEALGCSWDELLGPIEVKKDAGTSGL